MSEDNQNKKSDSKPRTRVSKKQKFEAEERKKRVKYGEEYDAKLGKSNIPLLISRDDFVEQRIRVDAANELKIPVGIYQEKNRIKRQYHLKFLEAIKSVSPHIIDDLRHLTPNFKALFGEISTEANEFGEHGEIEECLKKLRRLEDDVFDVISSSGVIRRRVPSVNSFMQAKKNRFIRGLWYEKMSLMMVKGLNSPDPMLKGLNFPDQTIFIKKCIEPLKTRVNVYLKESSKDFNSFLEKYFILKDQINKWADTYHLKKQWLYEFACRVLCQFTKNPDLSVKEIKLILPNESRELQGDMFHFRRRGWWAGGETAKNYEKYILSEIKKELEQYFYTAQGSLRLDNQTQVTKPNDQTFKGIYYLIAWNEGATNPQIAEIFSAFNKVKLFGDDVKNTIKELKKFGLPKRSDRSGRKYMSPVSNDRLIFIRDSLIENIAEDINKSPQVKMNLARELDKIKTRIKGGKS